MNLVLTYDVVNNSRRQRFYRRLKKILEPVQKSVFEGRVPARKLAEVERLIHEHLDLETDAVAIYSLCPSCAGLVRRMGVSPEPRDPDAPIVI